MFMHEVTPSSFRPTGKTRAPDGGEFTLAVGTVDGRDDVALVGHRSPSNVGEPAKPVRWYRPSPYRDAA